MKKMLKKLIYWILDLEYKTINLPDKKGNPVYFAIPIDSKGFSVKRNDFTKFPEPNLK